ncbi:MAG: O-antigen ligase [Patiriisocius sp.]|jgi:O-antigen ligase
MITFLKRHKAELFPNSLISIFMLSISFFIISLFLPVNFNSLGVGLLGIAWLVSNPFKNFLIKVKANRLGLFFILFYFLHALGLLYTANMEYGGKELEYKLSLLLIPLFLSTGPKLGEVHTSFILRTFYIALLLAIGMGIFIAFNSFFTHPDPQPLINYLTYRNFSTPIGFDPIYLALFIVFGIFAYLSEHIISPDFQIRKLSPVSIIILLTLFTTLIFLSSRMEILVFIVCVFALSLYYFIQTKKWKTPLMVAIVIPLFAYFLISINTVNKERFTEMVDLETDYTENKWGGRSIRIEKWKNAIECIVRSPIIGVGTGDTIDELVKIYEKNKFDLAIQYRFNPHNQYLQTTIALGILGLSALLLIFVLMFLRGYNSEDWMLMIFVLVVTMSMLTESMLERQKGLVFIVFFSMLLWNRKLIPPSRS